MTAGVSEQGLDLGGSDLEVREVTADGGAAGFVLEGHVRTGVHEIARVNGGNLAPRCTQENSCGQAGGVSAAAKSPRHRGARGRWGLEETVVAQHFFAPVVQLEFAPKLCLAPGW